MRVMKASAMMELETSCSAARQRFWAVSGSV